MPISRSHVAELTLQRLAAVTLVIAFATSIPNAVAQRAASSPKANVEQGRDLMQMLGSCRTLPRRRELLCAKKVLSGYVAELEPLLPQLDTRIGEHRLEIANQEANVRRLESELAQLDGALKSPQLTSSNRQEMSQRAIETRVHIAARKWNIMRDRTAIQEKEPMLQDARRSLTIAKQALQQVQEELEPRSQPLDMPTRR